MARADAHADAALPADLASFIEEGRSALDAAYAALDHHASHPDPLGARFERIVHVLAGVKLHAPLPRADSRLAMAGGNFADHLRGYLARAKNLHLTSDEAHRRIRRDGPWGFWKLPGTVIGPDETMIYPERARFLDYEGEVAVVIGPGGHDIPERRAPRHIWGYTLVNDWTIFGSHEQPRALSLNLAKNFDTSCSLGPCIVVDEIDDPQDVAVETWVNGELRQQGTTRDMVFSFAEYIAHVSRDVTLAPGDVVSAGSPAGTAGDSSEYDAEGNPSDALFVHRGDEVEVSSPCVGALRNRVRVRSQA